MIKFGIDITKIDNTTSIAGSVSGLESLFPLKAVLPKETVAPKKVVLPKETVAPKKTEAVTEAPVNEEPLVESTIEKNKDPWARESWLKLKAGDGVKNGFKVYILKNLDTPIPEDILPDLKKKWISLYKSEPFPTEDDVSSEEKEEIDIVKLCQEFVEEFKLKDIKPIQEVTVSITAHPTKNSIKHLTPEQYGDFRDRLKLKAESMRAKESDPMEDF